MLFQNDDSLNKNKNFANKVTIQSNSFTVEGYLLEPLTLRLDAKWEPLVNVDHQVGNLIKKAIAVTTNGGLGKTDLFTKQVWDGGAYLAVEGTIRMVNWGIEEDFNTLVGAILLAASPQATETGTEIFTGRPESISFKTQSFHLNDLVIKLASVEYSRELTTGKQNGKNVYQPLYADISFTLETRTVLVAEDLATYLRNDDPEQTIQVLNGPKTEETRKYEEDQVYTRE